MNDNGSLYDFVNSDYEAPEIQTAETPHANRQDMSRPYNNQTQQNIDRVVTESEPATSAETSWWRWFTRQIDDNRIAKLVNIEFNRSNLSDYDKTKVEYVSRYKHLLNSEFQ